MRTVNGLHALLVSAILCGMVQTAAGQSSAKAEVLAALAERDKAFVAGDETKVAQRTPHLRLAGQPYLPSTENASSALPGIPPN